MCVATGGSALPAHLHVILLASVFTNELSAVPAFMLAACWSGTIAHNLLAALIESTIDFNYVCQSVQVPPFPTKAGARYVLKRIFAAHEPGPLITMQDGTQQYGGVHCLTLCTGPQNSTAPVDGGDDSDTENVATTASRHRTGMVSAERLVLLSGGADGAVRQWVLQPPARAASAESLPVRGATLACATCSSPNGACACADEALVRVREPALLTGGEAFPVIKGLDWHHSQPEHSFVVGTSGCDLWAVSGAGPGKQRTVLDGHSASVHMVAPHPTDANLFVTADESGTVLRYNVRSRLLEARTVLGFKCYAIAVSSAHQLCWLDLPATLAAAPPAGSGVTA